MDCAIYILIPTIRLPAINQGISTHSLQTRGMCIGVIHWYLFAFQDMPTLDHIQGTCLPGKAFADCLMVAEFLHNFKDVLDRGEKEFLAATKQLYEWFSPSVCPSVSMSVRHTFLTMFPSSYHHEIFRSYYQWQKWRPCKKSWSEVKGQGQRGQHPT